METVIEQKEMETGLVSMISNISASHKCPLTALTYQLSTEDLHPSDTSDTLNSADRHSYTCVSFSMEPLQPKL